jgi:hypothetical protein
LQFSKSGVNIRRTWIDLGSVVRLGWLIATTIKSAKGESVFKKLNPLALAQGIFIGTGSPERTYSDDPATQLKPIADSSAQ